MRGEANYLHEEWLGKSVPFTMEEAAVTMPIVDDKKGTIFFNLLDNFKLGIRLTAVYLFSFVAILAISFLINELSRRIRFERTAVRRALRRIPKFWERIVSTVKSFGTTRLSAVGLFFLFVNLFIWVTQLFLTNNIKVEVFALFYRLSIITDY